MKLCPICKESVKTGVSGLWVHYCQGKQPSLRDADLAGMTDADLIEQQAERIKQLVELCRLQHVALIELSPCMYKECQQVQKETQDHAIAAFNKFEGGE